MHIQYFFSFFSFGKEALNVLRFLVEDTTARQIPEDLLVPPVPMDGDISPKGVLSKKSSMQRAGENKPVPAPIRTTAPQLEAMISVNLEDGVWI
jgi:sterol 3beta-glucosyltransferase